MNLFIYLNFKLHWLLGPRSTWRNVSGQVRTFSAKYVSIRYSKKTLRLFAIYKGILKRRTVTIVGGIKAPSVVGNEEGAEEGAEEALVEREHQLVVSNGSVIAASHAGRFSAQDLLNIEDSDVLDEMGGESPDS